MRFSLKTSYNENAEFGHKGRNISYLELIFAIKTINW